MNTKGIRSWLHDWYVTLRWTSRLTSAGRRFREVDRDIGNPDAWIEVGRPGVGEYHEGLEEGVVLGRTELREQIADLLAEIEACDHLPWVRFGGLCLCAHVRTFGADQ